MRRLPGVLATSVLIVLFAAPALAHVTLTPAEAPEDGFATLTFQVGHACGDSPTVSLSVGIPAGVVSVEPEVKPGWDIAIEEGTLPEPVDYSGETITEGVLSVTWSIGHPEDEHLDQVTMSVKLPAGEGETLYFPVVQTCESGEHAWIEIPTEGETGNDLAEPAPALVLTAAEAADSQGSEEEATEEEATEQEVADDSHTDEEATEQEVADDSHTDEEATEQQVAGDSGSSDPATATGEVSGDDGDTTDPMTITALVVGGLGLLIGGSALVIRRRRS